MNHGMNKRKILREFQRLSDLFEQYIFDPRGVNIDLFYSINIRQCSFTSLYVGFW